MNWYVLLIQPSRETIAVDGLTRRSYAPWWPSYQSRVRLAHGRKGSRLRAVIPGYLFLQIRNPDWARILDAPGVREVIRDADDTPIRLTIGDIEVIRHIEEALNADPVAADKGIPFKVGDKVRLSNDTLCQWEGTILAIDKRRRITVEVRALLGRSCRVVVPADEVEAA